MRKSVFTTVLAAVFAVLAMTPAFAGSLDQGALPSATGGAMSTLTDIYNCMNTGNCAAKRTVPFAEPTWGPTAGTGYTLDDIMNLAKQHARVPKTGQTASYAAGDDGILLKGVASPVPRFTDNLVGGVSNGTVTDNLTGLIWLKDANCAAVSPKTWADALTSCNSLASGTCGLTDGSTAGQWRLPNLRELHSLIDYQNRDPALPTGHPFSNVQPAYHWSATTNPDTPIVAWVVYLNVGVVACVGKTNTIYVLPVR